MKANIIYKLTTDVYIEGRLSNHNEKVYDELCDARYDLNLFLQSYKVREETEKENGNPYACCHVHERCFDRRLPDVNVVARFEGESCYHTLTYEIQPL